MPSALETRSEMTRTSKTALKWPRARASVTRIGSDRPSHPLNTLPVPKTRPSLKAVWVCQCGVAMFAVYWITARTGDTPRERLSHKINLGDEIDGTAIRVDYLSRQQRRRPVVLNWREHGRSKTKHLVFFGVIPSIPSTTRQVRTPP
jgi:hypothetical protein